MGLPPNAIAKRVEMLTTDGRRVVQHLISAQIGDVLFEVICMDGVTVEQLTASIGGLDGMEALPSDAAGTWFGTSTGERRARIRITTIAGRACMASVEGATAQVPDALLQLVAQSLRAAPDHDRAWP